MSDADRAPVRVLLVDDDARFAAVVRAALTDDGYDVVAVVHQPDEVLAAVSHHAPDVVVLDAVLEGGMGVEVAIDLRERGSKVPVVVFSSLFDRVEGQATLAQGFGWVEKAAGIEALESAIGAVIDLHPPAG